MTNNSFKYSFKVIGIERKVTAAVIVAELSDGSTYSYAGVPSFAYEAAGWKIDREGVITSPETPIEQRDTFRTVLEALNTAGASAEGNGTVMLSLDGHDGNSLRNLANLIWCKQSLIKISLIREEDIIPESLITAINAVPLDSLEDIAKVINDGIDNSTITEDCGLDFDLTEKTLSFSFFNATLATDEVDAFITLCWRLSEQAKQQKFSSTKQREITNECYAMRCFLLKLGFIGPEFKTARKILLANHSGNAAYRTIEAQQAAEAKRKARVLTEEGSEN